MAQDGKSGLDAMREAEAVDTVDMTEGDEGGEWNRRPPMLPDPCPVKVLGVQGKTLFFLDGLDQIIETSTKCDKGDLMLWFGNEWLELHYGTEGKERWDQRKAQIALIEDCRARGVFNPDGRVFGRGAHQLRGDEDQLVMHMGTRLMLANAPDPQDTSKRRKDVELVRAGELRVPGGGSSYYPARPPLPSPDQKASTREDAEQLMELLGKWYWVEEKAAPLLLMGGIAQMFICGALPWRSHIWLTSPTGSGKSTMQSIIRAIHGDWCLHTEDATAAAIRQTLGPDTLGVMIDEAEAHDQPERLQGLLNLMKKGSSGAKVHRGGADHKGHEFIVRSSFILSSVLHASMRGEDRNRIAILDMREPPENAKPPERNLPHWRTVGRKMHRRMIDQWPRYLHTWEIYKKAIADQRFRGRWQDTYGTLLACADLLLFDAAPDDAGNLHEPGMERVHEAVRAILPMMSRGRVEARTDVERCQHYLLSHMLMGSAGKPPEPIGTWLERAMATKIIPGEFATDEPQMVVNHEARDKLKAHGLRLISVDHDKASKFGGDAALDEAGWREGYLAVAYSTNRPLAEIFRGSEWADGIWLQSLGKVPGVVTGLKIRFGGSNSKPDNAIAIPLSALAGE